MSNSFHSLNSLFLPGNPWAALLPIELGDISPIHNQFPVDQGDLPTQANSFA